MTEQSMWIHDFDDLRIGDVVQGHIGGLAALQMAEVVKDPRGDTVRVRAADDQSAGVELHRRQFLIGWGPHREILERVKVAAVKVRWSGDDQGVVIKFDLGFAPDQVPLVRESEAPSWEGVGPTIRDRVGVGTKPVFDPLKREVSYLVPKGTKVLRVGIGSSGTLEYVVVR